MGPLPDGLSTPAAAGSNPCYKYWLVAAVVIVVLAVAAIGIWLGTKQPRILRHHDLLLRGGLTDALTVSSAHLPGGEGERDGEDGLVASTPSPPKKPWCSCDHAETTNHLSNNHLGQSCGRMPGSGCAVVIWAPSGPDDSLNANKISKVLTAFADDVQVPVCLLHVENPHCARQIRKCTGVPVSLISEMVATSVCTWWGQPINEQTKVNE